MQEELLRCVYEVLSATAGTKAEGVYFIGMTVKGSAVHRKIDVVVDADSGVRIDQCAFLSRRLRERLEEDEEMIGILGDNFDLVVGSPGLGEPIVLERQYGRHVGRLLRVAYRDPEGIEHELTGHLQEVSLAEGGGSITLKPRMEKKKGKQEEPENITLELAAVLRAVPEAEI
ncbi:MAG: ribosome maturation factor RimP [Candidatus Chlorobium antarcticum]|jgi:ribosome maturation factor RimP|nr:ribosome maturation factor RimP [Candidatus Chlorobium antarcticum]